MDEQPPAVEPVARDVADRSDADDVARAARQRDTAALGADQAAETRDAASADQARKDRISTAEDRAAAAHDREESALDRHGAAEQLETSYRDDLTGVLYHAGGATNSVRRSIVPTGSGSRWSSCSSTSTI